MDDKTDPVTRLLTLYSVATMTAMRPNTSLQYVELMDDLHYALVSAAKGSDPLALAVGTAGAWRDLAELSDAAPAKVFVAWADHLETGLADDVAS